MLQGANSGSDIQVALGRNLAFGLMHIVGCAIVSGEFEHKPFPTEARLAQVYGVSRSVTRETVKMLAAKGLLSSRPKQGATIQPITSWNLFDPDILGWFTEGPLIPGMIEHINALRGAIEPEAASLAAINATSQDLSLISRSICEMEASGHDHSAMVKAEIDFHAALLRASANPFYSNFRYVVRFSILATARVTRVTYGAMPDLSKYVAVRDMIVARDAVAASSAMRKIAGAF